MGRFFLFPANDLSPRLNPLLFLPSQCQKGRMSKKTLNEENLAALGADRLAHLLIEVSIGSAVIKRRLRLELSHNLGAEELSRDVRKRLTSIRRSTSFVGWRKRKALIKELDTQAAMIVEKIGSEEPTLAFDLLWDFIEMAPSIYERVDDSRGDVAEVFRAALLQFEGIAPRAVIGPENMAVRVWDALRDNAYGEFNGIIPVLAEALGDAGLEHLKKLVKSHQTAPAKSTEDHAALQFLRDLRSTGGNFAADQKSQLIKTCLQQIAVAQGDMDAFIAQYTPQDLKRPRIAAKVARLLLDEARDDDALDVLLAADQDGTPATKTLWDAVYIDCLLALGRIEDAQNHRWVCFSETLDPQTLRDYLKVLPDFEDMEFEDAAKAHALQFEDATAALGFFLEWPDLGLAARLIETRANELDGDLHHILTPAAESLRNKYPLAAVLLWRSMINHALWEGRTSRYGACVDHLMDCTAADTEITDFGSRLTHDQYMNALRTQHKHKSSFWTKVP